MDDWLEGGDCLNGRAVSDISEGARIIGVSRAVGEIFALREVGLIKALQQAFYRCPKAYYFDPF